jgi:hypothetical protein
MRGYLKRGVLRQEHCMMTLMARGGDVRRGAKFLGEAIANRDHCGLRVCVDVRLRNTLPRTAGVFAAQHMSSGWCETITAVVGLVPLLLALVLLFVSLRVLFFAKV